LPYRLAINHYSRGTSSGKIHVYVQRLIAGSGRERDLCSRERDGIRIELRGTGTGAGQLLAGTGGSGTGKLVPCNTLLQSTHSILLV